MRSSSVPAMKLSSELTDAFNDQITLEFEASITYRQLAIELEIRDLPGMALWLRHQADEEIMHANKFIDYVAARDNHPQIGAVGAPQVAVSEVLDVFRAALAHEERVSESIRQLYKKCEEAGDLESRPLLDWFLSEQVEEEATIREIVGRLELNDGDGAGLLRLDEELGRRPAAPTEAAG